MQHAMDFIGGEHRPVRQRQFQAHAMHLMRHVHGLIPDRPTDRSAPVSGIDQWKGGEAADPALAPAMTRTALPGRRRIASAIRQRRCRE
ncbi:hypothetical protein BRN43_05575 [Xanthomonas oryzae pv. oryzae]|nr:hypothetical protein BRN38_01610 [Xanthomonas oryzae pv. oryzae]RBL36312.1 hypothetical protein BRN43_05575 [Xanthomonas oryzae pv. oryzae]